MARAAQPSIAIRAGLVVATLLAGIASGQSDAPGALELTLAERQWLADHPEIRMAAYANYPPAQFIDEEGRHAGLAADYQHRIEVLLGIRFVEVVSKSWDVVLERAEARELDVLALAAETSDRRAYLSFTKPYLSLPAVIIARDRVEGTLRPEDLEGMRVAVPSGYAVQAYLEERYPQLTLIPMADTLAGLKAVSFGSSDVLVSDLSAASHFLEMEGISNLHIVGEAGYTYEMGFAVRSDWPEMTAILEKALAQITPAERDLIFDRWIRLAQDSAIPRRRFWTIVLAVLGVATALLGGTFAWNRSLKRRVDQQTRALNEQLAERQRAADALAASEERTRLIIDTAIDGVITMNEQGMITGWNPQAESDFGWSASEAVGRSLGELIVPASQRAAHAHGLARFLETNKGRVLNRRIVVAALHRDGHEFPIELAIAPIRKEGHYQFSAFVRDITDRMRAETELAQHRDHLEELVEERTVELLRAKDEADIANRAKSDFLANMSHEIRTPMTAILGYAQILRDLGDLQEAPPERIEAIDTICRNGDHLLALINGILDLSKLEAGKMMLELSRCSPARIASDVIDLMRIRADEKDLALELRNDGPVPEHITTDAMRLRQILVNLVGNALKFTDRGTVAVVLSFRDGTDPRLVVAVTDTGIGMDEQQREQVFRAFTQADTSTSRRFGGTGLGLSISRWFAELLGGDIAVTSRPGHGTTFTVTIATGDLAMTKMIEDLDAVCAVESEASTQTMVPEGDDGTLRGRRVLLAEDTRDNQRLIRHHLEKRGAEVEIANNGRAAVDQVLAARRVGRPHDIVLMDIQMPEMDGYRAAELLRARGCDVPIIALTASTMRGDRERCIAVGMDDHVAKPIDPPVLFHAILCALRARGGAAPPPSSDDAPDADPIDVGAVRGRFDSAELLGEVVEMFRGESDRAIAALRQAVDVGDREDLQRVAHRMKGCASNFGATAATSAAERLERLAGDADPGSVRSAATDLERRLGELLDALRSLE